MQSLIQYRGLRKSVTSKYHNEKSSAASSPTITDASARVNHDEDNAFIVEWDGPNDQGNPRNWRLARRVLILAILWLNVWALDWAGSADAQASTKIADEFHVSEEAEALSPALYNFGIGLGALFAGPISESVGRNPIYIGSRIFQVFWLLGVALAPNFGAQCAFRFLAGLGGSIILAIHAASVADLFTLAERTWAWPVIAMASFFGPATSPLIGAWIAASDISWRWVEWIALINSGATLLLSLFFLPETFAPVLLSWKARHIRQVTGNDRYLAEFDRQDSVAKRLRAALLRSFHMLTREPIVPLLGCWLILVYLVVYSFLAGYSFIFTDTYGFSKGITGTCYCAILAGCTLWFLLVPIYYRLYRRKVIALEIENSDEEGFVGQNIPGRDLPKPEYRLWTAAPVAILLPISLLWLGWTNYSSISPWSSLGAITLFSICWAGIYVAVYQYILDVYGIYAGSALAIITFFRYWASGAINLVSRPWYNGLGVHWVMTIVGCLAVLLAPAPFLLMKYGPDIRKRSPFAGQYSRPANPRKRTGRALSWT